MPCKLYSFTNVKKVDSPLKLSLRTSAMPCKLLSFTNLKKVNSPLKRLELDASLLK
jgi:hypothetical protein